MKKKDQRSTVRWTHKNQTYLARLGIIDGRSGRTDNSPISMSDFINECVTIVLEAAKHERSTQASPEELRKAYGAYLMHKNEKAIKKLYEENQQIARWMKPEEEYARTIAKNI